MDNIITAINSHKYLEFYYEGHFRKVIPFAYGHHVSTKVRVLRALQVGGTSSSGKFDFPKMFIESDMSRINVTDQGFETPPSYRKGDKHINPIIAEL